MKLSVVLVHYRTPDLLINAIESIHADLAGSGISAEILVVDNGRDPELARIAAGRNFRLLQPEQNQGYGAGLNRGVAQSCGDFIFLINADVRVLPGSTTVLLEALDSLDIVAPRLFWDNEKRFMLPPNESTSQAAEFTRKVGRLGGPFAGWARTCWRRHARRHFQAGAPTESRDLSGAFLATSRKVWEKVGPFDPRFRLYFEETDWLKRAAGLGYRSFLIPAASVVHYYRQSPISAQQEGSIYAESRELHARLYFAGWFRLLSRIPVFPIFSRAVPGTPLRGGTSRIELPASRRPLWIEVSPRPEGFPAAAELLGLNRRSWQMPDDLLSGLAGGEYWIRVVESDPGFELACYRFRHETGETRKNRRDS